MFGVGLQSCAVSFGGALGQDEMMKQGGAVGILVALLFMVGGAFAIPFPIVSLISFLAAAFLGVAAGATTAFSDLTVWGFVAFFLAVLSFFGILEKIRKRERQQTSRVS
jgi:hypothetical protein